MTDPLPRLDLRGLTCPLPVLKTRKALAALSPGAHLTVETTDPLATLDLPHFCREAGHRLVTCDRQDLVTIFVIERGA